MNCDKEINEFEAKQMCFCSLCVSFLYGCMEALKGQGEKTTCGVKKKNK